MPITDYASLLSSARNQEQPQRLLFTFTQAQAQPGGHGKSLTPVMCADKLPEELDSFETLKEESKQMQTHWDVVFVAGLAGREGQPPAAQECEAPLRAMVTVYRTAWGKRFGQRLRAAGKAKKLIIGAMMRKLVHVAFGVLRSGKIFDPTLHAA